MEATLLEVSNNLWYLTSTPKLQKNFGNSLENPKPNVVRTDRHLHSNNYIYIYIYDD